MDILAAKRPRDRALPVHHPWPQRHPRRLHRTGDAASCSQDWDDHDRPGRPAPALDRRSRTPTTRGLVELVGELSLRSERFRTLWARQDVKHKTTGTSLFNHPAGRAAGHCNYETAAHPRQRHAGPGHLPRPARQRLRRTPAPARRDERTGSRTELRSPDPHGSISRAARSVLGKSRRRQAAGGPHQSCTVPSMASRLTGRYAAW